MDHLFILVLVILSAFFLIRLLKPLLSELYNFTLAKNIKYDVMQIIEYRYRSNSILSQIKWNTNINRNFIEGVGQFSNEFMQHISKDVHKSFHMKKTIHRISDEEKKVYLKLYSLDGIEANKFITANSKYFYEKLKIVEENKFIFLLRKLIDNRRFFYKYEDILQNLKIKINIIITLKIKIHDENKHDIYLDTMKIYYSFNNLEEKKYLEEDILKDIVVVRLKVENSFYNLFIKRMIDTKMKDTEIE